MWKSTKESDLSRRGTRSRPTEFRIDFTMNKSLQKERMRTDFIDME